MPVRVLRFLPRRRALHGRHRGLVPLRVRGGPEGEEGRGVRRCGERVDRHAPRGVREQVAGRELHPELHDHAGHHRRPVAGRRYFRREHVGRARAGHQQPDGAGAVRRRRRQVLARYDRKGQATGFPHQSVQDRGRVPDYPGKHSGREREDNQSKGVPVRSRRLPRRDYQETTPHVPRRPDALRTGHARGEVQRRRRGRGNDAARVSL